MRDEMIACMTLSVPHPSVLTRVGVEGLLLIWEAEAPLGKAHRFIMQLPDGMVIGVIGLHAKGDGRYTLGYHVGAQFRGRGYATEAVCAMVDLAWSLGAEELYADHFADNPVSGRVLEKAGFAYTGETGERFSLGRGAKAATLTMKQAA
jgi:RimJ/RimL family protein N-acetyltransferase